MTYVGKQEMEKMCAEGHFKMKGYCTNYCSLLFMLYPEPTTEKECEQLPKTTVWWAGECTKRVDGILKYTGETYYGFVGASQLAVLGSACLLTVAAAIF